MADRVVVQVSPLLSSIVPCECGHPEGEHMHGVLFVAEFEGDRDVCWGHLADGRACDCLLYRAAQQEGDNR